MIGMDDQKGVRINTDCRLKVIIVCLFALVVTVGCGERPRVAPDSQPVVPPTGVAPMGYTIQVGAFSNLSNAVRLSETLLQHGLNAYYFVHRTGLYKVRFGNFASKESARKKAEKLHVSGVIDEYFIIGPEDYPQDNKPGKPYLRSEIVRTAKSFLDVPYQWGGTSPVRGFDCSGFSMAVYRLNGLNLPRSSKAQWEVGMPIDRDRLSKGDLVFFATTGSGEVSHVAIYLGGKNIIHAPGWGKKIRVDSLSKRYFRRHFIGVRSYL
jgi:hypothetical protein